MYSLEGYSYNIIDKNSNLEQLVAYILIFVNNPVPSYLCMHPSSLLNCHEDLGKVLYPFVSLNSSARKIHFFTRWSSNNNKQ